MIFDAIKCTFDVLHHMLKSLNMSISQIGKILCKIVDCICTIWLRIYYECIRLPTMLECGYISMITCIVGVFRKSCLFSQVFGCMGVLSELQLNM